jgi:glycine/D-amino acid oxidase-like deaminating enzyme
VIGAGFTGLASAYALAGRGLDVQVLEASRIGGGASGRCGGIALEDTAAGELAEVSGCIPALERLVQRAGIDCGLQRVECWELSHAPPSPGTPVLWRDDAQELYVEATVPAGALDPAALLEGLAAACVARGAGVHEGTPVAALEPGPPLRVALATGGSLEAERAVIALNAYSPELLPIREPLRSALTLALCTDPLERAALDAIGLAGRRAFYTLDLPYLWGCALADTRVIFGGGLVFAPDGDLAAIDVTRGDARARLAELERRVRGLHAALSNVRIERRWGGPIAFTPDRRPVLSVHPSSEDVIVAGGYAGHGVALSLRIAELIADAITDGRALPRWGWPVAAAGDRGA